MSRRQVPFGGIVASVAVIALGIVVNIVSPDQAFEYMASVAAIGIIFVWGSILVCHLVYRRQVAAGILPAVDYRLPGAPWTNALAGALLLLVVVLLGFTKDGRTALIAGAIWFVLMSLGFVLVQRRRRADAEEATVGVS
jgi:L-asparagine transporter-like permease